MLNILKITKEHMDNISRGGVPFSSTLAEKNVNMNKLMNVVNFLPETCIKPYVYQ